MTKLVFSKTLAQATWNNTRLLRDFDPRAIADMKQQPGKNMIVFGSGSIVSLLTRHGLIDEYQVVVAPVLLGGGKPLLAGLTQAARLELLDSKPFPSGNVILRYARAG
jgi:dihydrofolate reductase